MDHFTRNNIHCLCSGESKDTNLRRRGLRKDLYSAVFCPIPEKGSHCLFSKLSCLLQFSPTKTSANKLVPERHTSWQITKDLEPQTGLVIPVNVARIKEVYARENAIYFPLKFPHIKVVLNICSRYFLTRF